MGCGASSTSVEQQQSDQRKHYRVYHSHGTDYTDYSTYNQQYQQKQHEEYDTNQQNQHGNGDLVSYNEQDMWQRYDEQQKKYQALQKQAEIERERKLKEQLQGQLASRLKERQRLRELEKEKQEAVNAAQESDAKTEEQRKEMEEAKQLVEKNQNELTLLQKQMAGLIVVQKLKEKLKKSGKLGKKHQGKRSMADEESDAEFEEEDEEDEEDDDEDDDDEDDEEWLEDEIDHLFEEWDEILDEEEEGEVELSDDTGYMKWMKAKAELQKIKQAQEIIEEFDDIEENQEVEEEEEEKEASSNENEDQQQEMKREVEEKESEDSNWKSLEMSVKADIPQDASVGGLRVTVIDTMPQPDTSFMKPRPKVKPGEKFVDNEFPKEKALGKYASECEWQRPEEIYPDKEICLFHEDASIDDVKQGMFGDCYFMATIAALATQPLVMKQILPDDAYDPKTGIFHCRFWRFGHWHDMYLDDYLPSSYNWSGLCGARSSSYVGEMWVSLLEKAWAKFNISYEAMEAGQPAYAYQSFTGGCPELLYYAHAMYKDKFNQDGVYKRVSNALKSGSLVIGSASSSAEIAGNIYKEAESLGLVMNHAYTITAAALVKKSNGSHESLVRLRNPWAHKEWTGPYSDKSEKWNIVPAKAKSTMLNDKDNGEFWMPWNEFYKYFSSVNICHYSPDYDADGIADGLCNVTCIYGSWSGSLLGGWNNKTANPTFYFTATHDGWIVIELLLETKTRDAKKTTSIAIQLTNVDTNTDVGDTTNSFLTSNELQRSYEVKAKTKYLFRPQRFDPGKANFLLRVFSKHPLNVQ